MLPYIEGIREVTVEYLEIEPWKYDEDYIDEKVIGFYC